MGKRAKVERVNIVPTELFEFLWMARRYAIRDKNRAEEFNRIYRILLNSNPWVIREKPEVPEEYQTIIPWASEDVSWAGLPREVMEYWQLQRASDVAILMKGRYRQQRGRLANDGGERLRLQKVCEYLITVLKLYGKKSYDLDQFKELEIWKLHKICECVMSEFRCCQEKERLAYSESIKISHQDFFIILIYARLYASGRDTYAPGDFNTVFRKLLSKNQWLSEENMDRLAYAFPLAYRLNFSARAKNLKDVYRRGFVEVAQRKLRLRNYVMLVNENKYEIIKAM